MATMALQNDLRSGTFGLLPEPEGRFGSFTVSAAVNVVVAGLVLLLAMAQLREHVVTPRYDNTELVFPVPAAPKPVLPPVPKVKVVAKVTPKIELQRPMIQAPKPIPEPKIQTVKLNTPEMPSVPAARPKAVAPPPQPKVGTFVSQTPTLVANNRVAPTVSTGGFGNPVGVAPNPNATKTATIASVGSFNAAPGIGQGAGAARKGSVQGTQFGSGVVNGVAGGTGHGTVASAGFSNGVIGGTPGGAAHGSVASTGFGSTPGGTSSGPQVAKVQEPTSVPPIVTFEPRPAYTPEARQLKIQGSVTLEVRFSASGRIEVLRVVNGLGHGLDEQAKSAAEQIRFKPAMKNGQPVDQVTFVHISFQLA
jgi:TonB family protein